MLLLSFAQEDGSWHATTIIGEHLTRRTWRAASHETLAPHQCQQDIVRLIDGQRGVDAFKEGFHRLTGRSRPSTIDLPIVAAPPQFDSGGIHLARLSGAVCGQQLRSIPPTSIGGIV
jgi:hypothetical protein